jgi:hypothetical protein
MICCGLLTPKTEYIDALNNRHAAAIQMLVDEKVKTLKLNMQLRHDAFILFKECISSLIKSGASDCKVYLLPEKNDLLFTIQFTTDNCDIQQVKNMLLRQDIDKRLRAINAKPDLDVQKKHGVLELKVPM